MLVVTVKIRTQLITFQIIVIVVPHFFHRLEKKDLYFLLHVELEEAAAAVEQHQPLALVDLHRSVIRNQETKLGQLPLYV